MSRPAYPAVSFIFHLASRPFGRPNRVVIYSTPRQGRGEDTANEQRARINVLLRPAGSALRAAGRLRGAGCPARARVQWAADYCQEAAAEALDWTDRARWDRAVRWAARQGRRAAAMARPAAADRCS